jgi:hypothetical protein
MVDLINGLQWPGMVTNVIGSWLMTSSHPIKRHIGFWFFIASNVCWAVWGFQASAYALIVMQFALAILNIRGLCKTEPAAGSGPPTHG